MMGKVRFETSDALGLITLANPPLNLFDQELIDDLRAAVNQARQHPLRALLVRADGKNFSGGADVAVFKGKTAKRSARALHQPSANDRRPGRIAVSNYRCRAGGLHGGGTGTRTCLRSDMGGFFGKLRTGRGIDWNDHAAGRRSTSGGAGRPESRTRNYLYGRPIRRRDLRAMEHRKQSCSRRKI